jgi:hypothetical protein
MARLHLDGDQKHLPARDNRIADHWITVLMSCLRHDILGCKRASSRLFFFQESLGTACLSPAKVTPLANREIICMFAISSPASHPTVMMRRALECDLHYRNDVRCSEDHRLLKIG